MFLDSNSVVITTDPFLPNKNVATNSSKLSLKTNIDANEYFTCLWRVFSGNYQSVGITIFTTNKTEIICSRIGNVISFIHFCSISKMIATSSITFPTTVNMMDTGLYQIVCFENISFREKIVAAINLTVNGKINI